MHPSRRKCPSKKCQCLISSYMGASRCHGELAFQQGLGSHCATDCPHTKRLLSQMPKDKNRARQLHALEVECLADGKTCTPYEFCVKLSSWAMKTSFAGTVAQMFRRRIQPASCHLVRDNERCFIGQSRHAAGRKSMTESAFKTDVECRLTAPRLSASLPYSRILAEYAVQGAAIKHLVGCVFRTVVSLYGAPANPSNCVLR
jgi:hypothetical protein